MNAPQITIHPQDPSQPLQVKLTFYAGNVVHWQVRKVVSNVSTLVDSGDTENGSGNPTVNVPPPLSGSSVTVICVCIPTSLSETFKIDVEFLQNNNSLGRLPTLVGTFVQPTTIGGSASIP